MKMQLIKGRLVLKGIVLIYFLISGMFANAKRISALGDIRIKGVSVKVGNGAFVTFSQGISVSDDSRFWNEGSVYFINKKEEILDINTLMDGSGTYYIQGPDGYTLKGNGAAISSLTIDDGSTLRLANDLSIVNLLDLKDGVIDVEGGVELKIQSTKSGAISFDNTEYNTSFVSGRLVRNTVQDIEYFFPVGSGAKGFHPFKISSVSASGYVGVAYKPDFSDTWSGSENSFQLETIGGWEVTTAESSLSFIPGLSLYNNYSILDNNYNIFYSANPVGSSSTFSLDFNSEIQGTNLTTETSYPAGTFALANIISDPVEIEGVRIPKLVNFLVQDGTGRTTFDVPGLRNYEKVTLSVYNRFGNLVYQSGHYWNDFDVKDYPSGTYFYELTLETVDGKRTLVRNIIEIMEHN